MKLIDKAAVVAEIEKRWKQNEEWKNSCKGIYSLAASMAIQEDINILSFLDTLEVKDVDINKEISQFIDANFEKATIGYKLSLRRVAKHFFELGFNTEKSYLNTKKLE